MIDLLTHWVLTWKWALYLALIVGVAGVVSGWFMRRPVSWAAHAAGLVSLALALFLAGYQTADDRAAHQAALQTLRNENARLARDLGVQKIIAANAAEERALMQTALKDRNQKVEDYEAKLASEKPQVVLACTLDAADIRANRSLRAKPRR